MYKIGRLQGFHRDPANDGATQPANPDHAYDFEVGFGATINDQIGSDNFFAGGGGFDVGTGKDGNAIFANSPSIYLYQSKTHPTDLSICGWGKFPTGYGEGEQFRITASGGGIIDTITVQIDDGQIVFFTEISTGGSPVNQSHAIDVPEGWVFWGLALDDGTSMLCYANGQEHTFSSDVPAIAAKTGSYWINIGSNINALPGITNGIDHQMHWDGTVLTKSNFDWLYNGSYGRFYPF